MAERPRLVVVGASAAGLAAVQAAAERDAARGLVLISAERPMPYKRTKVSKTFAPGFDAAAHALQPAGWYADHGIDLRLGTRVEEVDLERQTVRLDDGSRLGWDRLLLATGCRPRQLALSADVRSRVHLATSAAQVQQLQRQASRAETALVVGTGAVGVEVAEQLAQMGLQVTLVGESATLLADELNTEAARLMAQTLEAGGVELVFDTTLQSLRGGPDGIEAPLAGRTRRFDLAVQCIGMQPRLELARTAGLRVERGIVVDSQLRTSHPLVFAAGDVAQLPDGRLTHLWRHALQQGQVAGANLAGANERYQVVPFRLKCSLFGAYFLALHRPPASTLARYGVLEQRQGTRYRCCYTLEGRLHGVVMCNDGANHKLYNAAVAEHWPPRRLQQETGW